jgi:hypothetical protein
MFMVVDCHNCAEWRSLAVAAREKGRVIPTVNPSARKLRVSVASVGPGAGRGYALASFSARAWCAFGLRSGTGHGGTFRFVSRRLQFPTMAVTAVLSSHEPSGLPKKDA